MRVFILITAISITVVSLIIIPILERFSKSRKLRRNLFYLGLFCAVITLALTINNELSNYKKERKLKLLEIQTLTLKNFKIDVKCIFSLATEVEKGIQISRGGILFGFLVDSFNLDMIRTRSDSIFVQSEPIKVDFSESDTMGSHITLHNSSEVIVEYSDDNLAIVRTNFTPFDPGEILDMSIKELERYNGFYIPFKSISRHVPNRKSEPITISYKIIINGNLFEEYRMDFMKRITTDEYIILFHPDGMFRNVEGRYLRKISSI